MSDVIIYLLSSSSETLFPPQVFLDVDCSDVKYTNSASRLFRNILTAEDNYLRGYSDPSEINRILQNKTGLDDLEIQLSTMLPGKFCEYHGHGYVGSPIRRSFHPWLKEACSRNPKNPLNNPPLPSKYTMPIEEHRSQTPEEALQGSLLDFFTWTSEDFYPISPPDIIPSMTAVSRAGWESYLKEAFCRSVEPFSEIFDTPQKGRVETEEGETWLQVPFKDYDDPESRPPSCERWDFRDGVGCDSLILYTTRQLKYVQVVWLILFCPG